MYSKTNGHLDDIYTYYVHCNFSLSVLFTHGWVPCLPYSMNFYKERKKERKHWHFCYYSQYSNQTFWMAENRNRKRRKIKRRTLSTVPVGAAGSYAGMVPRVISLGWLCSAFSWSNWWINRLHAAKSVVQKSKDIFHFLKWQFCESTKRQTSEIINDKIQKEGILSALLYI